MLKEKLDQNPHLQKHLFEKGFLITNADVNCSEVYPFYGNWNKTTVGQYYFWIHSAAKLFLNETENATFFLIGHAYNPCTMEYEESIILQRIAKAYETGAHLKEIDNLTGVFVMGIIHERGMEILVDASGMQYACYGLVDEKLYISSHMRLIGDLCNLVIDSYVNKLIHYRWYRYMMGNYLPGDLTCFCELKRVLPNTCVLFENKSFRIRRFYPNRDLKMCTTQAEYEQVIEEASKILKNTMVLIAKKWERPAISLTGGVDSNTTFAAANGVYDRYSTFSYIAMYRESVDAEKAKQISKRFSVPHRLYEIPEENSAIKDFEIYKMLFNYNGGAIGKSKDNDCRKKAVLVQNDICDVEVKSWVSETIRAYAHKYFGRKRFPKSLKPRHYSSLYKLFFLNRKILWQTDRRFRDYITSSQLKEHLYNYDESDLFVWEMMHGGKCSLNVGVMKSYAEITIPYNNRYLLDLLLRVPLDKRISDQHHMDLKKCLNRELYDMNIRVINLNQPKIRGKVLNVYFTLNSILPF